MPIQGFSKLFGAALALGLILPAISGVQADEDPEECDPTHDKLCAVPVPGAFLLAYTLEEAARILPFWGNLTVQENRTIGAGGASASVNLSTHASWSLSGAGPTPPGDAEPVVTCADIRGCPDLIVDRRDYFADLRLRNEFIEEGDCNIEEGNTQQGIRRMLRFTFTTPNVGEGDLIVGDPDDAPDVFEWGTCHGHWHFSGYADYRLWTPSGYQQWREIRDADPDAVPDDIFAAYPGLLDEVVTGHKQGFCVMDVKRHDLTAPSSGYHCNNQGISLGWADSYIASLDGQFIDITDVPQGWYVFEAEANPDRALEEMVYTNNAETLVLFIN